MKRSSLLFFALVLLPLLFASEAFAGTTYSLAALNISNDVGTDGYANLGDEIRIEVVATYTPGESWVTSPMADCSSIGLGLISLGTPTGNMGYYSVTRTLTALKPGVNPDFLTPGNSLQRVYILAQ